MICCHDLFLCFIYLFIYSFSSGVMKYIFSDTVGCVYFYFGSYFTHLKNSQRNIWPVNFKVVKFSFILTTDSNCILMHQQLIKNHPVL